MLLTAITFLVILTVLVLIHEFGHFLAARIVGVRVEEFGLGLPPQIWGKKFGETIYSLNWLPIGGFVRLSGEDAQQKGKPAKHLFWARSKKERAVILTAGVLMNFLLAIGITTFLLVHGVKEPSGRVHVEKIAAGSPAEKAGIQVGDVLLSYKTPKELIDFVNEEKGHEVILEISRDTQQLELSVVPRVEVPKGEGPLGVAISDLELHSYSLSEAPGKAFVITITRAKDMLVSLGQTVWKLATLQKLTAEVAGPIGIAQVTGQAVKFGWEAVLEFASILSLNLAVLNILPIPALDGGRVAFVVLEKLFRKRVNPVWERNAHQVGMVILLALIVLVSINDILRLARGG